MAFPLMFFVLSLPLLSLLFLVSKSTSNYKSRFSPPGPVGLPLIGNLHQIHYSTIHTFLWKLSKSYGPIISLNFGFIPVIVISSASLSKEILKTQDTLFCSRPQFYAQRKLSYGGLDVALSPYNKYWTEMRKIMNIHLLSPKRVQSFRHVREDEVTRAMEKIRGLSVSSKTVNLSEIIKNMMMNILMRVAFGKGHEEIHENNKLIIGLLFDELQGIITNFFASDLWPSLPFVGLIDRLMGKINRLDKCFLELDSIYQELIDERLDPSYLKSNEEDQKVIDILIQLKNDQVLNSVQITDNHIKAMLMNVLVGGTDTTAATSVWAMTTLIKNPKVMKKAQEELRKVVGKKGKVEEEDLPKLTYLEAVLKEIMRLYPPVPLLVPRETKKETILNGYKIKPKTLVFVNAYAIGRDPESWESPEEFLPERFLDSEIDFKGNDYELIPFGAGRRICPGLSMAVIVVNLLIANLLYLFDWGLADGMKTEDIDFEAMPGVTMKKKDDLCLLAEANSKLIVSQSVAENNDLCPNKTGPTMLKTPMLRANQLLNC